MIHNKKHTRTLSVESVILANMLHQQVRRVNCALLHGHLTFLSLHEFPLYRRYTLRVTYGSIYDGLTECAH